MKCTQKPSAFWKKSKKTYKRAKKIEKRRTLEILWLFGCRIVCATYSACARDTIRMHMADCCRMASPYNILNVYMHVTQYIIIWQVALQNGKPTVVEFYASWCKDCKLMAPQMMQFEKTFGARGDVSYAFTYVCMHVCACVTICSVLWMRAYIPMAPQMMQFEKTFGARGDVSYAFTYVCMCVCARVTICVCICVCCEWGHGAANDAVWEDVWYQRRCEPYIYTHVCVCMCVCVHIIVYICL
jgi:thiol-disulfide isomerase/thioredoxin